ncbi:MAG: DUF1329 domain-containing protein [Nevskiales bacterium]
MKQSGKLLVAMLAISSAAWAKAPPEQAAKLGNELTPVGAEKPGNAEGSIPVWTGADSFGPTPKAFTRAKLEDFRTQLVKDIQQLVGDAGAISDMLATGQRIMDADPAKGDKVVAVVEKMLSADAALKADMNRILSGRGKSVDGLIADVKSRAVKLPEIEADIVAVITELKKDPNIFTRLVNAFDVGSVLELSALVTSGQGAQDISDLMLKYMPPNVRDFLTYQVPGTKPEDFLRPLYVVTRDNLAQHESKLTEGHKAMFKAYADYKMIVYPTARNGFFPEEIYKATIANASSAELKGTDDVSGARLGFPFPIPQSGAEVLWNHKMKFRGSAVRRYNNQAIVKPDGSYKISKLVEDVKLKYANLKEPPGADNKILVYYLQRVLEPPRVAGQITLVHEYAGMTGGSGRSAWLYNPGLGRTNRAPDVGYDGPNIGSDGEQFFDQVDVYNGNLDRYDWKLIGKKEMLIPYNSALLNSPTFKYTDIIRPGHINQDLARYELHRIWVVEANVRQGIRHKFARRVFYVDEDSWSVAAVDCYDARGQLWKFQEASLITLPFIPTVTGIPEAIYDLQAKRYFLTSLTNEDAISDFEISYDDSYFTQSNMAKLSRTK